MTTYVYSTHDQGRVAHIGDTHRALCSFVLVNEYRVSGDAPAGRPVCVRCLAVQERRARRTVAEAARRAAGEITRAEERHAEAERRRAVAARLRADRDAAVVALLTEGVDSNIAIARRLGVSHRTATRRINTAMSRAGARSRFQWGLAVGRAEAAA